MCDVTCRDRERKSLGDCGTIARAGHGGVEKNGIIPVLHDGSSMRRGADAGINNKRHIRKMRSECPQRHRVHRSHGGADWRTPRHQDLAAGSQQPFGYDKVVGRIGNT